MRGFVFFRVWKPGHRLIWTFLLALILGIAIYPFYGMYRERRAVQALSWAVAGKVIIVDPGHGGPDPGCVGKTGVMEKDVNLAIARHLANFLGQAGAAVVLTRDGDYDLSDPQRQNSLTEQERDDLAARVEMARKCQADLYISIHANSISSPKWWGAQVFHSPKASESKRLAGLIQQELLKALGNSYRWVQDKDFYVLRNVSMPAVMVEAGFLSHPREEILLTESAHQSKVAWCVYAGIVRYFAGEPAPNCPF